MTLIWMAIGLVLVLGLVACILLYNSLVRLKTESESAWAQIDVQLKRRHDLIQNLVETVRCYAGHERQTLERAVEARRQAVDASGVQQQALAENTLLAALRQVFVLSEAYPQLKANESFLSLQEELAGTENRISFSRQYYNDTVARYNIRLQSFPANVVGGMCGFAPREFFEIEAPAQREAPRVQT